MNETVQMAGAAGSQMLACACDIGNASAVAAAGHKILAAFGEVELLVNSAGTNAPRRSLALLSSEDYHMMINTNLNGAYYITQAVLPPMRKAGQVIR